MLAFCLLCLLAVYLVGCVVVGESFVLVHAWLVRLVFFVCSFELVCFFLSFVARFVCVCALVCFSLVVSLSVGRQSLVAAFFFSVCWLGQCLSGQLFVFAGRDPCVCLAWCAIDRVLHSAWAGTSFTYCLSGRFFPFFLFASGVVCVRAVSRRLSLRSFFFVGAGAWVSLLCVRLAARSWAAVCVVVCVCGHSFWLVGWVGCLGGLGWFVFSFLFVLSSFVGRVGGRVASCGWVLPAGRFVFICRGSGLAGSTHLFGELVSRPCLVFVAGGCGRCREVVCVSFHSRGGGWSLALVVGTCLGFLSGLFSGELFVCFSGGFVCGGRSWFGLFVGGGCCRLVVAGLGCLSVALLAGLFFVFLAGGLGSLGGRDVRSLGVCVIAGGDCSLSTLVGGGRFLSGLSFFLVGFVLYLASFGPCLGGIDLLAGPFFVLACLPSLRARVCWLVGGLVAFFVCFFLGWVRSLAGLVGRAFFFFVCGGLVSVGFFFGCGWLGHPFGFFLCACVDRFVRGFLFACVCARWGRWRVACRTLVVCVGALVSFLAGLSVGGCC
ncbi:sigma 54-interacting transcriptional regulator [Pseudomonas syringae]|uniref:sigma 54-interacting transcriptional regulator n=1 Tax=Pseudomonas syringae TaxID=317 RepID=UPI0013047641|nr:sigma 54-interacting transcriptional regulator [Pseudomonas syringae]